MKSKPKIVLLYKNSTYAEYFLNTQRRFSRLKGLFNSEEVQRFRKTHESHFVALSYVEAVLKDAGLKYTKLCRGTPFNYHRFDFVITFGGDGTFLEAARNVKKQKIWGVNSDPKWSVGRFCSGNPKNFKSMLEDILKDQYRTKIFNRLQLDFDNGTQGIVALNDVLICHQNPAAMSRYNLKLAKEKEEQKSSGVWVSTAAGSSGAIFSAGGKLLPEQSPLIQYRPRELYLGSGLKYNFTGNVITPKQEFLVTSLMREGVIFVDGSHVCLPFSFGTTVKIYKSSHPLKVIWS
ncbi:MAG: NAD(+)/NADH kinase [Candidatus Omnitrophica bacterium]|nr:NAD(+)/NADH kinase [Candidatus Omnitrophota bacterium]